MSGPENHPKLSALYTKKPEIWPKNKLLGPEFRLLPANWQPCVIILRYQIDDFKTKIVIINLNVHLELSINNSTSSFKMLQFAMIVILTSLEIVRGSCSNITLLNVL